jgi:hypothetical protein
MSDRSIKITDREIKNSIYETLEKYGFEDTDLDGYEYLIHILFHAIKSTTNPAKNITSKTYPTQLSLTDFTNL